MGQICTTIAKVVQEVLTGEVSKRTPADFIPRWGEDPEHKQKVAAEDPAAKKQSVEEMKKILYAIAGHQKKVKKEKKHG